MLEEENAQLRRELDDAHTGQTMLVDRLIACCKEVSPSLLAALDVFLTTDSLTARVGAYAKVVCDTGRGAGEAAQCGCCRCRASTGRRYGGCERGGADAPACGRRLVDIVVVQSYPYLI